MESSEWSAVPRNRLDAAPVWPGNVASLRRFRDIVFHGPTSLSSLGGVLSRNREWSKLARLPLAARARPLLQFAACTIYRRHRRLRAGVRRPGQWRARASPQFASASQPSRAATGPSPSPAFCPRQRCGKRGCRKQSARSRMQVPMRAPRRRWSLESLRRGRRRRCPTSPSSARTARAARSSASPAEIVSMPAAATHPRTLTQPLWCRSCAWRRRRRHPSPKRTQPSRSRPARPVAWPPVPRVTVAAIRAAACASRRATIAIQPRVKAAFNTRRAICAAGRPAAWGRCAATRAAASASRPARAAIRTFARTQFNIRSALSAAG
jgi:hypothetical protein